MPRVRSSLPARRSARLAAASRDRPPSSYAEVDEIFGTDKLMATDNVRFFRNVVPLHTYSFMAFRSADARQPTYLLRITRTRITYQKGEYDESVGKYVLKENKRWVYDPDNSVPVAKQLGIVYDHVARTIRFTKFVGTHGYIKFKSNMAFARAQKFFYQHFDVPYTA